MTDPSWSLKADEAKLGFYTGLVSWNTFLALPTLIRSALPSSGRCKLHTYKQLLLHLLKLHLNLAGQDLAYRFNVSTSTVSRMFSTKLCKCFQSNVNNLFTGHPEQHCGMRTSMPFQFRKFFRKCAVIIDCTEVFIEQPSDLLARAQTWSQYKHHNTVKFLIGITPR